MIMPQEIERKFLVDQLPEEIQSAKALPIEQGYLAIDPEGKEVRLRRIGDSCWLTVKSKGELIRKEFETKLSIEQFDQLWPATAGQRLQKTRFLLQRNSYTIEVDQYHQPLSGLIVAEVEFDSAKAAEQFKAESWMGQEVTHLNFMKNKNLLQFDHLEDLKEILRQEKN